MSRLLPVSAMTFLVILEACNNAPEPESSMDPRITAAVEAFKNRRIHKRLTPEILASIPDDKLEQAVFDYALVKIADNYRNEKAIVAALPVGVRALYLTWWVEAEVNNGGFNQYYWNSSGQFSDRAVEAFDFFSARKHADLMREANRIRSDEAARMQELKDRGSLEAFSASYKETKLNPLDDRFYKIGENLSALRIAKIRSSPALFSGE